MAKHTQAICRQQPKNCLSVFDHFVNLALKGLRVINFELTSKIRSSAFLTSKDLYEQFLAKKLHRYFLSESFFPSKMTVSGERKWIALRYGLDIKMNLSRSQLSNRMYQL